MVVAKDVDEQKNKSGGSTPDTAPIADNTGGKFKSIVNKSFNNDLRAKKFYKTVDDDSGVWFLTERRKHDGNRPFGESKRWDHGPNTKTESVTKPLIALTLFRKKRIRGGAARLLLVDFGANPGESRRVALAELPDQLDGRLGFRGGLPAPPRRAELDEPPPSARGPRAPSSPEGPKSWGCTTESRRTGPPPLTPAGASSAATCA